MRWYAVTAVVPPNGRPLCGSFKRPVCAIRRHLRGLKKRNTVQLGCCAV